MPQITIILFQVNDFCLSVPFWVRLGWYILCWKWDLRQSHCCRTGVSWSGVWDFCTHSVGEWQLLSPWVLSSTDIPPSVWRSHLSLREGTAVLVQSNRCWKASPRQKFPYLMSTLHFFFFSLPLEGFPCLLSINLLFSVYAFFHIIGLSFLSLLWRLLPQGF